MENDNDKGITSFMEMYTELIDLHRTVDALEVQVRHLKEQLHEARTENARLGQELSRANQ